ncbi:hypothetical protein GCM10007878_11780 [Marinospirillum insulare]|uniref:Uncharacterized protein n=1 Tax=Marinospirillum insulare TaxID=217169 RepID=A0ABQ5ZWP5_9GAMM|nr:hypothetical protein GCM10007878_11780 [Marinospirillum insulare]
MPTIKRCPECASEKVFSSHVQAFYINTGEHYVHSMKTHDAHSPSGCTNCGWSGVLKDIDGWDK